LGVVDRTPGKEDHQDPPGQGVGGEGPRVCAGQGIKRTLGRACPLRRPPKLLSVPVREQKKMKLQIKTAAKSFKVKVFKPEIWLQNQIKNYTGRWSD